MPNSGDPMKAVLQYVEAFNNGDSAAMAANCADPMQILDGMSPHVWQGSTAAEDWWKDVRAEGDHLGASGYRIALGEPQARRCQWRRRLCRRPCDYDVRSARYSGHTSWFGVHGRASQSWRGLASYRVVVGKGRLTTSQHRSALSRLG